MNSKKKGHQMNTITLEAQAARYLAEGLLPAASKDDITPVLTGIHLSIEDGKLRAVSTDRYRVHAVLVDLVGEHPDELSALIPRAAVQWLVRAVAAYTGRRRSPFKPVVTFEFNDADPFDRVTIRVREDAEADLDEQTFKTALIKGNYPPVIRLIEEARSADAADDAEAMLNLDMLSSLRALSTGVAPIIRFTKSKQPHKEGVVYFNFGAHAEALIQPHKRL